MTTRSSAIQYDWSLSGQNPLSSGGPLKPGGVCIFGASLDVSNRGVLALAMSVARLMNVASLGSPLRFHYGNATGGHRCLTSPRGDIEVEVLNCRHSPRSKPAEHILVILLLAALYRFGVRGPARRNPWLRSLLDADFIGDIRGGDSFSDIYGVRRFIVGSLPLLSVLVLGRRYVMLPQTYGPFRSAWSRWLAGFLLRHAQRIITRDHACEGIVQQIAGRCPEYSPDVAFCLEAVEPDKLELEPFGSGLPPDIPVIGVNVSGLLWAEAQAGSNTFGLRSDYRRLMEELVSGFLSHTPATVLLVAHEFGSEGEVEACTQVLQGEGAREAGRVFMVSGQLGARELKWVIGQTTFFVGARMHACIAALSQGVPAVGLAYSQKFVGIFASVGAGETVIDLRKVDATEVTRRVLAAYARRAVLRETVASTLDGVRQSVQRTFATLVGRSQSHRAA